jgi:hypothetical protein
MTDSMFGEVDFEQLDVDEKTGKGVFKAVDTTPYVNFIKQLQTKPAGTEARIAVITGEIITKGKSSKGRGKQEKRDAKNFADAASALGLGLRIGWRHLPDGKTQLRMMLQPKRIFSDETSAKRVVALDGRRLNQLQAKLNVTPGDTELQQRVKEVQTRIDAAKAVLKPPTKQAKATT